MNNLRTKPFLIILGIIFTVNFLYATIYQIKPRVDAEAYQEIATNIVEIGEYRATAMGPLELDGSITRIGPGYEYFVAGHFLFFGKHLWIIWLTQALLYTLTIAMLSLLTIKLFPQTQNNLKILYGTMLFFGLFIDMVQLNGMLMTESLFLFFLTLSFFIWSKIIENGKRNVLWWILLGTTLGTLTLIRPTGLIIFILLSGASIYKLRKKSILPILLVSIFFLGIQAPWVIRNYKVFGQFVFHSTADGMNFLSGNYPGNHGEFNSDFPLFQEMKEKYPNPTEFNKQAKSWYKNFVFTHPFQALKIKIEKLTIFFSLAKTSGFWFHYFGKVDQLATILISIFQSTIIIGSQIFFWIFLVKKYFKEQITPKEIFVIFTTFALMATPILTVIASRHRLPFMVMSFPIVFFTLNLIFKKPWKENIKTIIVVVSIVAVSTAVDTYLQLGKLKDRIERVKSAEIQTTTQNHV